jgi:hypothetical protein
MTNLAWLCRAAPAQQCGALGLVPLFEREGLPKSALQMVGQYVQAAKAFFDRKHG